jgi:hypothetical protein
MSGSGSSVAREGACVNSDTSRESDVTQRVAQATATPGRCLCVTWADTRAAPSQADGGVVCVHDSARGERQFDSGSIDAVRDVAAHDERFEQAEVVDTLTVLRRAR